MRLKNLALMLTLLSLLFVLACSGKSNIDPIRSSESINPVTTDAQIVIACTDSGEMKIVEGTIQNDLTFSIENQGLTVQNHGAQIYDLTLSKGNDAFSFGIISPGMKTAALNLDLQRGNNIFNVDYNEKPFIEINNNIIHTDGFDFSHAVITGEYDGYIDNEILFGFNEGTSDSERFRIIREHNIFLTGINTSTGLHVGRIDDGRTPFDVIEELKMESSVKWPGVNGLMRAASWPSDPVWWDQASYLYRWSMQRIHAQEAWDVYKDGVLDNNGDATVDRIVLCIADTGVHPHTDFNNDAVHYWAAMEYSKNFDNPSQPPLDNYGHGTAVAGIAGAIGDNEAGIAGVCWGPYMLSLKCLSDWGYGSWEAIGNSISYVGEIAAIYPWYKFVANYSLGGWSFDPWIAQAATYADSYENTFLVAACGNSNAEFADDFVPASLPEFMSVGASSIYLKGSQDMDVNAECPSGWGTNFGTTVEVCAPGSMFVTTTNIPWNYMDDYPDPECPYTCDGWYCDHFGGTSAASPHVAGLVALLWNKCPQAKKHHIRTRIKATADPMAVSPQKEGKLGTGRINCYRALTDPY